VSFEHEDDFPHRKVDGVALEAMLTCIERQPLGKQLGRLRLAAVFRAGNDRDAVRARLLPDTY
jgi:hypothetical protein